MTGRTRRSAGTLSAALWVSIAAAAVAFSLPLIGGCSENRASSTAPAAQQAAAPPTERHFRMGFTPFPHDLTVEALTAVNGFLRDNADLIADHFEGVPWAEAHAAKPFHPKLLEDWQRHKDATPPNAKVYLAVSPIDMNRSDLAAYRGEREGLPVPEPLAGKAFDDPLVERAYLRYCREAIRFFQPDYLAVGIEVNELYHHSPAKWPAYVRLHEHVYDALKREHPGLPIFVTFTLHNMLNPEWRDRAQMLAAFKKLMAHSDLVAVSFYPFMGGLTDKVDDSLNWVVRELGPLGKPLAIAEMGQPAEPLAFAQPPLSIPGDEQSQRRVLEQVLGFCHGQRVEFVIWFVPRDYDALWDKIRGTSPEFFKAWKDCGLLDGQGNKRPAYDLWQQHFRLSFGPR